jgi:hypothetical protein
VNKTISNVSVHAFCVATRWALRAKFPNMLDQWEQKHFDKVQAVAEEVDARQAKKLRS